MAGLRPIDGNGHVPGEIESARCRECGLVIIHAWDCSVGLAVRDVCKLLEAAEVLERRWPGWTRCTTIAGVMRMRAERLSRSVS